MKSVLIVGGAGFLGKHIVDQFWSLKDRPTISVFDVRPLPDKVESWHKFDPAQIQSFVGDITKETDVVEALKKAAPDVVVHTASPMHGLDYLVYRKVNVWGTEMLLRCSLKQKVRAFVYTSSAGVQFNGTDLRNADETWPMAYPHMDAYNETKAQAEEMVLNWASSSFKTVAIRPAGIFGPGDRQMIPGLRKVGEEGKHVYQLGDNLNLFDITYVGNVAYAHLLAAQKTLDTKTAPSVNGEAFIITNDSPIYFWSLGREIWKHDGKIANKTIYIPKSIALAVGYVSETIGWIFGKEATITPYRVKTACSTRYFDITKAKEVLGYKPQIELEEALKYTIETIDQEAPSTK